MRSHTPHELAKVELRARHKISYRRLQARSERRCRDAAFSQKGAYGANEAFREKRGGIVRHNERSILNAEKSIPKDLDLWRGACPELAHFEPVRSIEHAAATGAELLRACGLAGRAFDGAARDIGPVNAGLVALFVYQRHADGERAGGTPIRSPGGLFVSMTREIAQGHNDLGRALTTMRQKRRVERRH